ncbi:MAG: patatin-like phospholipase family protein [Tumebacillaceae bacterium]
MKLAFSGGGFRATFYSLGAYRRLVELGVQEIVSHISSVSGGSLTAGAILHGLKQGPFFDVDDFDRRVTVPLRRFGQLNLRRRLLMSALRPQLRWESLKNRLSRLLQETLDRELFHDTLLADLPRVPEWSCNATCLNTMRRFRFKPTDVYGKALGLCTDIFDLKMSLAVAASNAFPLLFAPVRLDNRGRHYQTHEGAPVEVSEVLYLTDGGVYDNLGTDNLLKEPFPFVLLDASLEAPAAMHGYRPRFLNLRLHEISFQHVLDLRRRLLNSHFTGIQLPIAQSLRQLLDMLKRPLPDYGAESDEWDSLIASLRTDLDAFHTIEIEMLMWAGAARMDAAVKTLFPHLLAERRDDLPAFPRHEAERVRTVLSRGRRRALLQLHKQLT